MGTTRINLSTGSPEIGAIPARTPGTLGVAEAFEDWEKNMRAFAD